ncbi:MAG: LppX_LprAFG lipoprotein [Pseudonocardiales bacterium]|nr:LppX_LprAFG lipoprotein [Pseudonocardiales bacterium]
MTALQSAPYDRRMRLATVVIALIIALVTSCGGGGGQQAAPAHKATLPPGATLLADSAAAMRTVTTTHFAVNVAGNAPEVQLRSAEGQLTRDGSAQGTATVDEGRQTLEMKFAVIGGTVYLQPPTGPVQKLPASMLSAYLDPSAILDPNRGIAAVLASGQGATTQDREQLDGVDSYRLKVDFPAQPLGTLVPGLGLVPGTSEVWVAAAGSRLIQAQFPTRYGTATVHFSDFDAPVQITPPA